MATHRLSLPYRPPYDWAAMVGFLAARAIPGVEHVGTDFYARSIALPSVPGSPLGSAQGRILVRPGPEDALAVTICFPDDAAVPAIAARIRLMFDLDADPGAIDAHLGRDAALAPLVAARPGLRVPGAWDGFELAVRGILGQQISVNAATALAGKLVALCGETLPAGSDKALEGITHVFPPPARVIGLVEPGLALNMPRKRAAAIVGLAAATLVDPGLFEAGGGLQAAIFRLCALPGIGEWTAQYIAMRALRQADAFPAADIGLLRAMADAAGRPSPAQLLARAEAWRPWRAYAALHLWMADAAGKGIVS
ncbi:MAG: AlkA N-terminal domain-containing protein [Acidiphilium sp.]